MYVLMGLTLLFQFEILRHVYCYGLRPITSMAFNIESNLILSCIKCVTVRQGEDRTDRWLGVSVASQTTSNGRALVRT